MPKLRYFAEASVFLLKFYQKKLKIVQITRVCTVSLTGQISVTHFLLQESGKLILVTKPTQLSQDERFALQTLCNIHTYTVILTFKENFISCRVRRVSVPTGFGQDIFCPTPTL